MGATSWEATPTAYAWSAAVQNASMSWRKAVASPSVPPRVAPAGCVSRAIVMSIAANMLGLNNAATPLGIKAIEDRIYHPDKGQPKAYLLGFSPQTGATIIMIIAVIKATLVAMIFMHLKWDWSKLYFMIIPALVLAPMLVFALLPDIVLAWKKVYTAG